MGGFGGIGQSADLFQGQHGAFLTAVAFFCYQCRTESAHDTGDIGTGNFHAGYFFKSTQHGVVIEGTALYHDMATQFRSVCQFNDLIQCVFDNGIGKACGNIRHAGSFFLGLLYIGIHKHRAAGTQIHRMLCEKGFFRKFMRSKTQRVSKVFNEATTAGRTGFIQQNRIHAALAQFDALHILPADVQHAVHFRVEERSCRAVRHCFHFAFIQRKSGFQKRFAIACGAGTKDPRSCRKFATKFFHSLHGRTDRVAAVIGIVGIEQLAVTSDEGHLGGGRAGINAQKAVTFIGGNIPLGNHGFGMAGAKSLIVCFLIWVDRQV